MLIGVISDTHDKVGNMKAALDFLHAEQVALVVHCGDWKSPELLAEFAEHAQKLAIGVRGVLGNNDVAVAEMLHVAGRFADLRVVEGVLSMENDGRNIAAYHGHHKPTLRKLMENAQYDIVLLGHTHKPMIVEESGRLLVNPGSTAFSIPRSKSWRPTVAIVDTTALSARLHYYEVP